MEKRECFLCRYISASLQIYKLFEANLARKCNSNFSRYVIPLNPDLYLIKPGVWGLTPFEKNLTEIQTRIRREAIDCHIKLVYPVTYEH